MKRALVLCAMLAVVAGVATADFAQVMERADELNDTEHHDEAREFLEAQLRQETNPARKSEIAWRLARACMYQGDAADRAGAGKKELLAFFEAGENYGQMAIDLDSGNFNGYFWKSGNSGRWGQTKGVLKALSRAGHMRELLSEAVRLNPEDEGSYYVLGQLYHEVPGRPIGFGNIERAVNLGRKAVDLMEREVEQGIEDEYDYDYYTELAKHLYKRRWSIERRDKKVAEYAPKYRADKDPAVRNFYYEGVADLPRMTDRDEARMLARKAIDALEAMANRKQSENDDLEEAKEALASFKRK